MLRILFVQRFAPVLVLAYFPSSSALCFLPMALVLLLRHGLPSLLSSSFLSPPPLPPTPTPSPFSNVLYLAPAVLVDSEMVILVKGRSPTGHGSSQTDNNIAQ